MPDTKLKVPIESGINTQSDPYGNFLVHARNGYYLRNDRSLRRRPGIASVVNAVFTSPDEPYGSILFESTDGAFKKLVSLALDGTAVDGAGFQLDIDTPGQNTSLSFPDTSARTNPAIYNNVLLVPSNATTAPTAGFNSGRAWDGLTADTRELGIDINNHSAELFTIDVSGGTGLTFTTGRKYTYTLRDSNSGTESMPLNDNLVVTFVDTGAITDKAPVITVDYTDDDTLLGGNSNNNMDTLRLYATADGGVVYFLHTEVDLTTILFNGRLDLAMTITVTDAISDATLLTNNLLVYNSPPPPGRFAFVFQNKLCVGGAPDGAPSSGATGESSKRNVLYYSLPDEVEEFPRNLVFNTSTQAIPFGDNESDELMGGAVVNRVALIGLRNSVWTINNLPVVGVAPLFSFDTLKDRIIQTHGFVSEWCYAKLQITNDEDAIFYVSDDGFYVNNGTIDFLVSPALKWDKNVYNELHSNKIYAVNDRQRHVVIVGFPSPQSNVVDTAYAYHYDPAHIQGNAGTITGPWDWPIATAAMARTSLSSYEVWGISNNLNQKMLDDSATTDNGALIPFEWETAWMNGSEDLLVRLRELNFVVRESTSDTLAMGDSTVPVTQPRQKFVQLNSSGSMVKVRWDDDKVIVKSQTGDGDIITENHAVSFTTLDRSIISASIDLEPVGEDKPLAAKQV